MTHTHHKWPCPKSGGRHDWIWNTNQDGAIPGMKRIGNKLYIPVECVLECGAYGIEVYSFDELIEGE